MLVLALAQEPSAAVPLTERLSAWKGEIERLGGGRVIPVRVHHDRARNLLVLPSDTPERAVARRYFLQPDFVAAFNAAHALTLNYDGPEGRLHFVLLNMARAAGWAGGEESLIAHEFGHAWLEARGWTRPEYGGGPSACIRIHAGDIVQHVLIRAEMSRRGYSWRDYLAPDLEETLAGLEREDRTAPPADVCRRAWRVALWIDVRLGLPDWSGRDRFLDACERAWPDLRPLAGELSEHVAAARLDDHEEYRRLMDLVEGRMRELLEPLPGK
jgi:hypothetical protein